MTLSYSTVCASTLLLLHCSRMAPPPPASAPAVAVEYLYVWNRATAENVGLRIATPASKEATRHYDGKIGYAPVVVYIPGSFGDGTSGDDSFPTSCSDYADWVAHPDEPDEGGMINIRFLFPGGSADVDKDCAGTTETWTSGGDLDNRGRGSISALTAVITFALGRVPGCDEAYTASGSCPATEQTLIGWVEDLCSDCRPERRNVGLVGNSNGGNIAAITLGLNGERFTGGDYQLTWYLGYENPSGDHYILKDLNLNDDSGSHSGYVRNSCKTTTCRYRTSSLYQTSKSSCPKGISHELDSYVSEGIAFHDGGNSSADWNDADKDCEWDGSPPSPEPVQADDKFYGFVVHDIGGTDHAIYSREVTQHIWDSFSASLSGTDVATPAEAIRFWLYRDPSAVPADEASGTYWDLACGKLPDLKVMVVSDCSDHKQATDDHPHVHVQYHAWLDACPKGFVRLNPDDQYTELFGSTNGKKTTCTAVDNAAGEDWRTVGGWAEFSCSVGTYVHNDPYDACPQYMGRNAGIYEMADRGWDDDTSSNLTARLYNP